MCFEMYSCNMLERAEGKENTSSDTESCLFEKTGTQHHKAQLKVVLRLFLD